MLALSGCELPFELPFELPWADDEAAADDEIADDEAEADEDSDAVSAESTAADRATVLASGAAGAKAGPVAAPAAAGPEVVLAPGSEPHRDVVAPATANKTTFTGGTAVPPITIKVLTLAPGKTIDGDQPGFVHVDARVVVNKRVPASAQLMLDAQCKIGDEVVTDSAWVSGLDKELPRYRKGATVPLSSNLFISAVDGVALPCQLGLRLQDAPREGREIDLGQACWDGKTITSGTCDPAIAPPPTTGSRIISTRLSKLETTRGSYEQTSLLAVMRLVVHDPPPRGSRTVFKAACQHEGKWLVDVRYAGFPRHVAPGSSHGYWFEMFIHQEFDFEDEFPLPCELTTVRWSPTRGRKGELEETVADQYCLRDWAAMKGPCEPGKVLAPAGTAAMSPDNTEVDGVRIQLVGDDYGVLGYRSFAVEVRADFTPSERLAPGQDTWMRARCEIDGKVREGDGLLSPTDTSYEDLQPGETARAMSSAVRGVDRPTWCEVDIVGGESQKTAESLATFCYRAGSTTVGSCGSA